MKNITIKLREGTISQAYDRITPSTVSNEVWRRAVCARPDIWGIIRDRIINQIRDDLNKGEIP